MFRGIESKGDLCQRGSAACSRSWGPLNEGYNVVIDVSDPVRHDARRTTRSISLRGQVPEGAQEDVARS